MNLHGMPGLLGGVATIFIVDGISKESQITGIAITIFVATITGFMAGKLVVMLGRRTDSYDDQEEFEL